MSKTVDEAASPLKPAFGGHVPLHSQFSSERSSKQHPETTSDLLRNMVSTQFLARPSAILKSKGEDDSETQTGTLC